MTANLLSRPPGYGWPRRLCDSTDLLIKVKFRPLLDGVDKINNVAVACYSDAEGACHGNKRSTRRHQPSGNIGGRPPALKPEHIAVLHDIVTESSAEVGTYAIILAGTFNRYCEGSDAKEPIYLVAIARTSNRDRSYPW